MVSQGLIASRAFSLDLRSVDSANGSLIFGGVDTGKYAGSLAKQPILDPADSPSGADRYWINMTSVGLTLSNGTSGLLASGILPVFLDSGGTLSRFPNETFFAIGDAFSEATFNETTAFYDIDCAMRDETGSVDFGFGEDESEKVISISYADFIWNQTDEGQCVLGIAIDNSKLFPDSVFAPVFSLPQTLSDLTMLDEPVLGDSFLRAAYVVYDQDNGNLHLAQAEDCGENIIAIGSGVDAVPSSTGQCTGPAGTVASTALFGYTTGTMSMPTSTSSSGCEASTSTGTGTTAAPGSPTETGGSPGTETLIMDSSTGGASTGASSETGSTSTGTAVQVNIVARETGNPIAAFGLAAAAAVLLV